MLDICWTVPHEALQNDKEKHLTEEPATLQCCLLAKKRCLIWMYQINFFFPCSLIQRHFTSTGPPSITHHHILHGVRKWNAICRTQQIVTPTTISFMWKWSLFSLSLLRCWHCFSSLSNERISVHNFESSAHEPTHFITFSSGNSYAHHSRWFAGWWSHTVLRLSLFTWLLFVLKRSFL